MDNMKTDEAADKMLLNSKLRSPNPVADPHTMDSFQDGGQAIVKMERNDFQAMAPLDGSTMNADMNSYPPNPRDPTMSGENYDGMNDTMVVPGPMQGYAGYNNRGNYLGEPQHGAATGNADSQYHGYYPQTPGMRPGFTGTPKAGMRPGMGGMVSPGYPGSAPPRGMVSGQTISQQSGPTPTLNQLLQNQNSTPRSRNYYGDYGGGVPQKPAPGDMSGSAYSMQHGWGPPRGMEPYPQAGQMPGSNQYRSQGSPMTDMKRQSGSGNVPPNYSHQPGSYPNQQFSPNSQRYNLSHGPSRSGQSFNQQMPPQYGQNQVPNFSGPQTPQSQGFMNQHSSPQHQGPGSSPQQQGPQGPPPSFMQQNQQASPQGISRCSSGSKRPSEDGDSTVDGGFDDVNSENSRGTPTSSGIHHPVVSSLRTVTSPVGSTGSRSNTPASIPGTQASSPMPPRPPSRQHDGQSRLTQSPMTTQGNYHRQQAMPSMQGPPGMQGYSQQNMYNGPMMMNPMHNSSMYNSSPMNRGVPGGYAGGFSQGNNNMAMASQYGSYNSHGMVPQGGMGSGGMGPMGGMSPQQHGGMNSQGGPGAMSGQQQHGGMNSHAGGAMGAHQHGMNSQGSGGAQHTPVSSSVSSASQKSSMNSQSGVRNVSHQPESSHVGPPHNVTNSSEPMPSRPPSNAMRSGRISPMNIMNSPAGSGGGMHGGGMHHQQQQAIMNSQGGTDANATAPIDSTGNVDSGTGPPAKRAQEAADAAMLAAANSTNRAPAFNRPANHVRMYGPPPGTSPLSPMGAMAQMGQQTNSTINSAPNSVHMPSSSSMSHSPVPNSLASSHMSSAPSSNSNTNIPPLVSSSSMSNSIASTANSSTFPTSGNGSMSNSSTLSYPSDIPNPDGNSQDSSDFGPRPPMENKCVNSSTPTSMTNHVSAPTSPGSSIQDKHEAMITDDSDQGRSNNAQESRKEVEHSKMPSDDENSQPITMDMSVSTSGNTVTVVTQCFSTPVVSISETYIGPDVMPPESMTRPMSTSSTVPIVSSMVAPSPVSTPTPIPVPMVNSIDEPPAEKKKKASGDYELNPLGAEGCLSHVAFPEDLDASAFGGVKGTAGDVSKLFEMGNEMDRRPFLEKLMYYLEERGTPLTAMPAISKQPLDLFKLYLQVQGRGGMVEVTKAKKWKEICGIVNIGCSASAAFTLKKNYIKYMFSYECKYERGGIDPQPILAQMEATLAQKRESKRSRAPSPGKGSQSSQDTFRPPSTPSNSNSQGLDPFSPGMQPHYMQNDGGMGPMPGGGGMIPPNSMMNPPNTMMGGNMGHHHMPGHMMQPSPMMGGGSNNYMGSNNMMGNSMGPPNSNMMPSSSNSMMPGGNNPMMQGGNTPIMQSGNAPMMQSGNAPMIPSGNTPMMPSGSAPMMPSSNSTMMPSGSAPMMPSGNAPMMPSGSTPMMPSGNTPMMPSGSTPMMPSGSAPMMPSGNAPMMPSGHSSKISGNSTMMPGSNNSMMPNNSSAMMSTNSNAMMTNNSGPMMSSNNNAMMSNSNSSSNMGNANSNTMPSTNSAMLPNNSSAMAGGNSIPNDSNSVSVQDPFADEPSSTSNFSRQNLSNQFSGMPSSQNNISNNFSYGNRPSNAGSHFPSMNQNNSSSFSEGNNRMPSPGGDQFSDSFPRRPQMSGGDSFGNTNSNNSSSQFPTRSGQGQQPQGQFPYGQQFDRERFDQPTPGTPNQAYRHPPQSSTDQSYPNRYGNIRPSTPQQSDQSFPNQTSFSPPANRMMMPDQPYGYQNQQQGAYPSPRPPMKMEGGNSMNTPNKWYPQESERRDGFNMPPAYSPHAPPYGDKGTPGPMPYPPHRDNSMNADLMPPGYPRPDMQGRYYPPPRNDVHFEPLAGGYKGDTNNYGGYNSAPSYNYDDFLDSRREPVPWPQRYPVQHAGPNMPPSGPNMGGYPNRSMSQRMSPSKSGKSCLMHNPQFPPKKELVFSPHTVEGVQPLLTRRRRITSKDIGPLEAWRIMMSLKSGLLAESTWALDTLTILLFDDYTLPYFNLNNLPGLLETLLEHFRRHLIDMFGLFEDMEVHKDSCHSDSMLDSSVDSDQLNNCSDCTEDYDDKMCKEDNNKKLPFANYTHITRQGKAVTVEEQSEDCGLLDEKEWDVYTGFATNTQHWRLGGGDLSHHILTHFECLNNKQFFRSLYFKRKRKLENKNEGEEAPQIKKEHSESEEDCGLKECTEHELCSPSKPTDIDMESDKNCLCESGDNCNNYIKSEPRENELEKGDSEDSQSTLVLPQGKSEEPSTESEEKMDAIKEGKENEQSTTESVVCNETSRKQTSLFPDDGMEEEAYKKDNAPLYLVPESKEEIGRRCVCISNIFRSLSCLPGNELEMSKHPGLLKILGKLLLLHHRHVPRPQLRQSFDREEVDVEDSGPFENNGGEDKEWWWDSLNHLRENTLVIIANISGHLDISKYPEEVCHPLLDGLLHWAVCPSSCAQDPLPTMSPNSVLTPQGLVLESLCKLSILEDNVDLILATPPFDRILQLFEKLTKLLANKKQQVPQEFAIVLLSALVQGSDCAARAVALQHPFISLLIDFLETAEQAAVQVANSHGIHMLRDSPELMGTSLDMLRRAASILVHLSRVPENRTLFLHQQSRLLSLVMSQILDQHVAQLLSDVLYECCNNNS